MGSFDLLRFVDDVSIILGFPARVNRLIEIIMYCFFDVFHVIISYFFG
jgi:hypothetical protein